MQMTHSVNIAAPPHIVFQWVSEPDKLVQWISVLQSEERLEDKPGHVGSRFRQRYKEGGREFTMDGQVTRWEQDRAVSVHLTSSMVDITIDQDLEPISIGTRVTQRTNLQFKGVMKLVGGVMGALSSKKNERQMQADFDKLKGLAEAQATDSNHPVV